MARFILLLTILAVIAIATVIPENNRVKEISSSGRSRLAKTVRSGAAKHNRFTTTVHYDSSDSYSDSESNSGDESDSKSDSTSDSVSDSDLYKKGRFAASVRSNNNEKGKGLTSSIRYSDSTSDSTSDSDSDSLSDSDSTSDSLSDSFSTSDSDSDS